MPPYSYVRQSVTRNPLQDLSPTAQESAIRSLAERHGDAAGLVVLTDLDASGRLGRDKRPGYNRLLQAIESGRCTSLYSYSLSRLGRSVAELSRLIGDCVKRGIPVRLYVDALDTTTASGMLLFHVLASVAEFESEVASERTRAANSAKLARGGRLGPAPYGDGPGQDVELVLSAFHQAGSYTGAAAILNQTGVRPRNSRRGLWWPSSVAAIVQRLEPRAARLASPGVRVRGSFILARMLRCPACDTFLTGTRDRAGRRVRYSCRLGSVLPHQRSSISESLLLPWVVEEIARAEVAVIAFTSSDDDVEAQRKTITDRLSRASEAFIASALPRDRWLAEKILAEEALRDLPEPGEVLGRDPRIEPIVDMADPDPAVVNRQLRGLFREFALDPSTLRILSAEWVHPAWRRTD